MTASRSAMLRTANHPTGQQDNESFSLGWLSAALGGKVITGGAAMGTITACKLDTSDNNKTGSISTRSGYYMVWLILIKRRDRERERKNVFLLLLH